ncbi:hypothetical protein HOC96_07440 [archaeon]|jgi:hypothetical protein|nr:hypothetical protein [archaeon]
MKENIKYLVLVIMLLLISVGLTITAYSVIVIKDVIYLDTFVNVEDVVGFNIETDKLNFGTMPAHNLSSGDRKTVFHNPYDHSVKLTDKSYGEMEGWVTMNNPDRIFLPGETDYIYFTIRLNDEIEENRNYTGYTKVFVRRVFS